MVTMETLGQQSPEQSLSGPGRGKLAAPHVTTSRGALLRTLLGSVVVFPRGVRAGCSSPRHCCAPSGADAHPAGARCPLSVGSARHCPDALGRVWVTAGNRVPPTPGPLQARKCGLRVGSRATTGSGVKAGDRRVGGGSGPPEQVLGAVWEGEGQ